MPNKEMACYKIWKLWFEKHFPFLNWEEIILVWHSLWATFLTKYLSENRFPKMIDQLHIISPAIDEVGLPEWDNYIWDFRCNLENIHNIQDQCKKLWIWHSKDDPVVPFNHSERLIKELPNANFMIFEDRWHFNQEHFPELIETIKNN
jgi:predicted alpha/beta hydrolase family esterase